MSAIRNVAALLKSIPIAAQQGLAEDTGDNTEIVSAAVDRITPGAREYDSAVLAVAILTTLADGETLSASIDLAESDDGTTFDAPETLVDGVVMSGEVTADLSLLEFNLSMAGRKRFINFTITFDLSAVADETDPENPIPATDVFVYAATLIVGRADRIS